MSQRTPEGGREGGREGERGGGRWEDEVCKASINPTRVHTSAALTLLVRGLRGASVSNTGCYRDNSMVRMA